MFLKNRYYYTDNLKLAVPIILSNVGQALVSVVDNMMVGRLGDVELAAAAFSGMLVMNFIVVGMGFSISLTPLTGRNFVLGRLGLCARLFQNSLILNVGVSLLLVALMMCIYPFLGHMGQAPEVVAMAKPFYLIIMLSVIPYMVFLSFKQFMEGVGNTKVAMAISIGCNLLNVLLNYMFIYGNFGAPQLGVFGAGLATFIARLSMPVMFYVYMKRSIFRHYLDRFTWRGVSKKLRWKLFFYGYPISLQMVAEFFSLSMVTIMMGWIGVKALAANQITYSIMSIAYLVVSGVASAVTILVSFNIGLRDYEKVRNYAVSGVQLSAGIMLTSAIIMTSFGSFIASLFNSDPEVIRLAANMMYFVGLIQVFDGMQVTFLGALRGINDVKAPMYFAFLLYVFTCVPFAYVGGFLLDWGIYGVWGGFGLGLLLASILYSRRFFGKTRVS